MSQGKQSQIHLFNDFMLRTDVAEVTIADAAANYDFAAPFTIFGAGGEVGLLSTVDEPGGVMRLQTAGTDNTGFNIVTSPVRYTDGTIELEVRFKLDDQSLSYVFIGFQETIDVDDYNGAPPVTYSGTTLTDNNTGQTVGIYFDADATTDDWRAILVKDGTTPSAVTADDNGGVRAQAHAGAATLDDEWQLARILVYPDGAAEVWFGNEDNDGAGSGPELVAEFGRSGSLKDVKLDTDSPNMTPVVALLERSGAARIMEIDYIDLMASRDWSV